MSRSLLLLLGGVLLGAVAFLLLRPDSNESAAPVAAAVDTPVTTAVVDTSPTVNTTTPATTYRVRGRVEDERGKPVRDAEVRAAAKTHEPLRANADERGRFEIELPGGGEWRLAASGEGLLPWEGAVSVTPEATEIVIKLSSAGQLAGQVRGYNSSARYLVTLEGESGTAQQSQSDPAGRYQFAELAPGTYRVGLQSSGASWDDLGQVTIRAGERAAFDIAVPEIGGAIELFARLPNSAAAARPARVELFEATAKRQSSHDVLLSADGQARIEGIPSGSYQLRVYTDAAPPSAVVTVQVQAGSTSRVGVSWGASRVAGRVLASGRGAAATVRVQRVTSNRNGAVPDAEVLFETQAGPDGSYSVDGLLPGEYLVSARGDGYAAERLQVSGAGVASLDLAFPSAGSLEVSVEATNGPVEGATVFAVRQPLSDWAEQGKTDARGHARITSIPAGNYKVVATLEGTDAVRTAVTQARISPGGASTVALFVGAK